MEKTIKARVKATGEIVEVKYSRQIGPDSMYKNLKTGEHYIDYEIAILPDDDTPDYWTRLEHQAAIAAMQGMLNNSILITGLLKVNKSHEDIVDEVTDTAIRYAHAIVEKMK